MTLRSSDPFAGISVHLSQQNFKKIEFRQKKKITIFNIKTHNKKLYITF